ncbi:MAG: leucyl aminopeptidase [Legionellaceae bacterium]|nr:leucyl aminopeptidase [Legionellaceae bacterium]
MTYGLITTPTFDAEHCTVIGFFENNPLPVKTDDAILKRLTKKLTHKGDVIWHQTTDSSTLLVHCGHEKETTLEQLSPIIRNILNALNQQKTTQAIIYLPQIKQVTPNQQIEYMLLQFDALRYTPPHLKSQPNPNPPTLESIQFYLEYATDKAIPTAIATATGISWTRDFANLPANQCTPSHIAKEAVAFAKQHKSLSTRVLERKDMQKLGMNSFLSVSNGSDEPPKLVEIQYTGTHSDKAPIVLVGKGITFDSGGISLKPPKGMHEMKYDMAGAASVLGVIKACTLMKLPLNVTGLLACSENMPGGNATKPGDVITSMLGKTIEITNTDAEGRLVLCDTLTYAERLKPELVIDIATLTGAVIVSLGRWASGLMTEDERLAELFEIAGRESCDPAWRLPLNSYYQEALESPVADMINASLDGEAGSLTAACFLSNFTKNFRWAHLDIAGTAWNTGKKHNATGRPVPLLMNLLRHLAHAH